MSDKDHNASLAADEAAGASDTPQLTHAAGPWRILDKDGECYHVISADATFQTGCIAFDGRGFANAQLIASAPELLAALKTLVSRTPIFLQFTEEHREQALDAIAKAEGR